MAIILTEHDWPAKVVKSGHADGPIVTAGQRYRIETNTDGEDVMDEECPAGKMWSVRTIVCINETDI